MYAWPFDADEMQSCDYSGRKWSELKFQIPVGLKSEVAKIDAVVEELHGHPECFEGARSGIWFGPFDVLVQFKDKLAQAGCNVLVD